jgi:L-amino acid N-acyltransferase YncA
MIYLAPFKIEHFDEIVPNLRQNDVESIQGFDPVEYRGWLESFVEDAPIATFMTDQGVAAIGGAVRQWDGVADWWMLTSHLVEKYPLAFYKAAKDGLAFMVDAFDIHRLQAAVRQENMQAIKWAESHGFENEGLMVGYGPDKSNHYRYARIRL